MVSGPLNGIRLLEFSQIIAGPLGCQLLSDLGAEVIKVEPPQGEPWRVSAQFIPFESKSFQGLNRGKKSLAIDVAAPEGQAVIHRLVKEMDVVVINYRPDVAARLHIDYETLSAITPNLIYVDNTAFGRKGELADKPGYDIVTQALSGLISAVGKVDENDTPLVPPPFADTTTAYAIATGVCAALFYRAMTGRGQKIETSLLINALTIHTSQFMSSPAADADQRATFAAALNEARSAGMSYAEFVKAQDAKLRTTMIGNLYYRCFLTADGAIAIGALSAELRAKIRTVLGIEHNRDEPGYNPLDPEQQEIDRNVVAHVEDKIRSQTSEFWVHVFQEGGVPVSPINFVQELIDHPQVLANDYVVELVHDLSGPQRMAAPPWKMSASPLEVQGASPPLGRDTEAILASLGYLPAQVAELRRNGVIR